MKKFFKWRHLWVTLRILFLFCSHTAISQGIVVELGNSEIALNEPFTITITGNNEKIRTYDDFPEIPGMIKRGTSTSSSTNIANGNVSFTQSTTQNYMATRQGKYVLKPFTIKVNGINIKSSGTTITVGPPRQAQRNPFDYDPFEDFFGKDNNEPREFIDIKADAFFGLMTNKNEVYVGEGVTATLAFYVSAQNRAEMDFYDLGNQLNEVLKKVKPNNCWEENFSIEQIEKEPVVINNKTYTQYKLYQGVFYPLNVEDIVFPSVGLKMIKYKVASRPSFFGDNRQEDLETFHTQRKVVKVKDLPPHPLKQSVAVGNYRLEEKLSPQTVTTGQAFNYYFKITGEGNIAGLNPPSVPENKNIEFYAPNIRQNIVRSGNRVTGAKNFSYYAIPTEPGSYKLGDFFQWIFFNPVNSRYDTLKSALSISITGESKTNSAISSTDLGSFYDQIEVADGTLASRDRKNWTSWFLNAFILIMIAVTLIILIRK